MPVPDDDVGPLGLVMPELEAAPLVLGLDPRLVVEPGLVAPLDGLVPPMPVAELVDDELDVGPLLLPGGLVTPLPTPPTPELPGGLVTPLPVPPTPVVLPPVEVDSPDVPPKAGLFVPVLLAPVPTLLLPVVGAPPVPALDPVVPMVPVPLVPTPVPVVPVPLVPVPVLVVPGLVPPPAELPPPALLVLPALLVPVPVAPVPPGVVELVLVPPVPPLEVPPPAGTETPPDGSTRPSVNPTGLWPTGMVWSITFDTRSQYSRLPSPVVTYARPISAPVASARTPLGTARWRIALALD